MCLLYRPGTDRCRSFAGEGLAEMLVHITRQTQWDGVSGREYRGDTLASEGFIHCSTRDQVVRVANARFHGERGLVLLCIAPERVRAEIRYEAAENGERFPHVYGALNVDAVVQVLEFPPGADGSFSVPAALAGS